MMRLTLAVLLFACTTPEPDPVTLHPEAAALGGAEARTHMSEGTWQILVHGPPQPEDATDPATGLPQRSHGCEISDEDLAWTEGYNQTMRTAAARTPPFPDDLTITYEVTGPGVDHALTVTRAGVRCRLGDKTGELGTLAEDRVRVGALTQASRKQVPAMALAGDTVRALTLQQGADAWSASWGAERTIIDPRAVKILDLWREQASGL
ncbi:MAG: hypothetical protein ACI8S6_005301 [Myxococcota bacterium]|jgi:hypothetical protein